MHEFPNGVVEAIVHASRSVFTAEKGYVHCTGGEGRFSLGVRSYAVSLVRKLGLPTDHQLLENIFGSKRVFQFTPTIDCTNTFVLRLPLNLDYLSIDQSTFKTGRRLPHRCNPIGRRHWRSTWFVALHSIIPHSSKWSIRSIRMVDVWSFFSHCDALEVVKYCFILFNQL